MPGQFSEWSDGQTLVNRGMRLSPWESPRFLWAAVEGLAGIKIGREGVSLSPEIPNDWRWLLVRGVAYRDGELSYFLTRQENESHVYTADAFDGDLIQHSFKERLADAVQTITTGISTIAFRNHGETLVCLGSSLETPSIGPYLAHRALDVGKVYRVLSLTSHQPDWDDLGIIPGRELQRIVVQVGGNGYALYRFIERG